jgi:hypothetical protein
VGPTSAAAQDKQNFLLGLWGVRYQVKELGRSIALYTEQLGFNLDQQKLSVTGGGHQGARYRFALPGL